MSDHTNIVRIKAVNNALQELRDSVVFVGGQRYHYTPTVLSWKLGQQMTWMLSSRL